MANQCKIKITPELYEIGNVEQYSQAYNRFSYTGVDSSAATGDYYSDGSVYTEAMIPGYGYYKSSNTTLPNNIDGPRDMTLYIKNLLDLCPYGLPMTAKLIHFNTGEVLQTFTFTRKLVITPGEEFEFKIYPQEQHIGDFYGWNKKEFSVFVVNAPDELAVVNIKEYYRYTPDSEWIFYSTSGDMLNIPIVEGNNTLSIKETFSVFNDWDIKREYIFNRSIDGVRVKFDILYKNVSIPLKCNYAGDIDLGFVTIDDDKIKNFNLFVELKDPNSGLEDVAKNLVIKTSYSYNNSTYSKRPIIVNLGNNTIDLTNYMSTLMAGKKYKFMLNRNHMEPINITFTTVASFIDVNIVNQNNTDASIPFSFTWNAKSMTGQKLDSKYYIDEKYWQGFSNIMQNTDRTDTISDSKWNDLLPGSHNVKLIISQENDESIFVEKVMRFTKKRRELVLKCNDTENSINLGNISSNPGELNYTVVPYEGSFPSGYDKEIYIDYNGTRYDITQNHSNDALHLGYTETFSIPENIWEALPLGNSTLYIKVSNNNHSGQFTYTFNKTTEVEKIFETIVNRTEITTNIGFDVGYTIENTYTINTTVKVYINDTIIDEFIRTNGTWSFNVPTSKIEILNAGSHIVKFEFITTDVNQIKRTHNIKLTVPNPGKAAINCTDTNMGSISDTFISNFNVITTKTLKCDIKLNGTVINTFDVNGTKEYQATPGNNFYSLEDNKEHTLSIVVYDGVEIVHDIKFVKVESNINVDINMSQFTPTMNEIKNISWNVQDKLSNKYTYRIYANGVLLETNTVNNGPYLYSMADHRWNTIAYGLVDLEIRFISISNNESKSYYVTFTKVTKDGIDFYTPVYLTSKLVDYVYISMDKDIKSGSKLHVQVCTNPFSSRQTWINITNSVNVDYYKMPVITNDSEDNGILVRVTVEKGTSTEPSSIGNMIIHCR